VSLNSTSAYAHIESENLTVDDIRGQVVAMSKEQRGCRLLQQAIERGDEVILEQILAEVKQHLVFLMVDPFGNYLFQKLIQYTEQEKWQSQILASVAPHLIPASLNPHGTRAVQKILEIFQTKAQVAVLTQALRGSVVPLATDSNGNHVIQQCLQHLPPTACEFIFDEMTAEASVVSKHRHGCCVVQRCIDKIEGKARERLLRCISENALELMQDAFGNYVVQYMLDNGGREESDGTVFVDRVVAKVRGKIAMLAQQKYSSNVVEACLKSAKSSDVASIVAEITEAQALEPLLSHQYGNYVVQRALTVCSAAQRVALVKAIEPFSAILANHAGGRNILEVIGNDSHSNTNQQTRLGYNIGQKFGRPGQQSSNPRFQRQSKPPHQRQHASDKNRQNSVYNSRHSNK
jgi:hypothetical protein